MLSVLAGTRLICSCPICAFVFVFQSGLCSPKWNPLISKIPVESEGTDTFSVSFPTILLPSVSFAVSSSSIRGPIFFPSISFAGRVHHSHLCFPSSCQTPHGRPSCWTTPHPQICSCHTWIPATNPGAAATAVTLLVKIKREVLRAMPNGKGPPTGLLAGCSDLQGLWILCCAPWECRCYLSSEAQRSNMLPW